MRGKACSKNEGHIYYDLGPEGTTERYDRPPYLCVQCHPSDKERALPVISPPLCPSCFPEGIAQSFLYISDSDIPESTQHQGYEKIRPWLLRESKARGAIVAECRTHWCVHMRGHFVIGPQREMTEAVA